MDRSSCIELTNDEQARLLGVARASIEQGHTTRRPLEPAPTDIAGVLSQRLGSFVTLTRDGALRGCVGSIEAHHPLLHGVAVAAFNAAFRDTRFPPLSATETGATMIEVSILSDPEPIDIDSRQALLHSLRPNEDGLVLEDRGRRATFLPKVWEKLPEPQAFLSQLMVKAGLPADFWSDSIRFYRYATTSFAESPGVPV